MKTTLIAVMLLSGCSYLQGLTAKSSEEECSESIAKAGAELCKNLSENRDKINRAKDALK